MTDRSLPLPVPADHPAYAGHFPGRPILPGVVLVDEALHVLATHLNLAVAGGQIRSAKFLSPVSPGESLRLDFAAAAAGVFRFEVVAANQERVVASGVFAFAAPGESAL